MGDNLESFWAQCQADTPPRRARLYEVFLLRSIAHQDVVAQVLRTDKSYGRYKQYFGFLHTDYTQIFCDEQPQTLRPELRAEVRRRLLTLRQKREVMTVIARILRKQQERMKTAEATTSYPDLRMRVRDSGWAIIFLDLLEARFWSDPDEALSAALPAFLAASLYHPELLPMLYELVAFFAEQMSLPQREWWMRLCYGFNIQGQEFPAGQMAQYLQEIRDLLSRGKFPLAEPFDLYQQTLLAALWWQEGEIFRDVDLPNALVRYHKALSLLYREEELLEHRAHLSWVLAEAFARDPLVKRDLLLKCISDNPDSFDAYAQLGYIFYEQKEYRQALKYFHYALELQEHHVELWVMLGVIHVWRKDYPRALAELNYAVILHPLHPLPYYNRADVHVHLREYTKALADYRKALELDPTLMDAYINRGNVYAMLKQTELARQDYEEAQRLQPTDMQALWLSAWISFGKQRVTPVEAERLQAIAEQDPTHYLASVCQGIFAGITHHNLQRASEALAEACTRDPDQWDPLSGWPWPSPVAIVRNRHGWLYNRPWIWDYLWPSCFLSTG